MPFVVLACLLALTGEGLLWCSSRTGGAVGEPCRFAQIQASSSGVRLSDFTGCFVLFALSYNCFSAPHRHTHTGPPSDHLTTIAPNPRLLVLITASQQPGALYPSTSPPSPHLLARQASCMHTLTSTPLHVCLHPPAVREDAQSLLSNPCSSSLSSSFPLAPISTLGISCCRTLLRRFRFLFRFRFRFRIQHTTARTCPCGWHLGALDVPLGCFDQVNNSFLALHNLNRTDPARTIQIESHMVQPSPGLTRVSPSPSAGLPNDTQGHICASPRGGDQDGSQSGHYEDDGPASKPLRGDHGPQYTPLDWGLADFLDFSSKFAGVGRNEKFRRNLQAPGKIVARLL